jgi:flavin reductase (DIM6/NTAB) family NADH-FMN oxidoreductase RutF
VDDELRERAYRMLTCLVVPRPIAWISTLSAEGVGNLAPHSFFNLVSPDPAVISFSSVGTKDTLKNIEATGTFVISLVPEELKDLANASSAPYEHGADEATLLDIPMEPSTVVAPPRVAASPASIECRLRQAVPVGTSTLVLGDVVAISVRQEALGEDGLPAMAGLRPMSRLGRDEWGLPPKVVHLRRPTRPD